MIELSDRVYSTTARTTAPVTSVVIRKTIRVTTGARRDSSVRIKDSPSHGCSVPETNDSRTCVTMPAWFWPASREAEGRSVTEGYNRDEHRSLAACTVESPGVHLSNALT